MGSLFEAVLVGEDQEHLDAVASAVREEVERLERLLSRFDPRSELSRVNREAAAELVRVDRELFDLLHACALWWEHSEGFFDITVSPSNHADSGTRPSMEHVLLDPFENTVRFTRPGIQLDLGGVGKGYALDCARDILAEFSVDRFFMHGGTSSALARGVGIDRQPWRLGVRDPWSDDPHAELCQVALINRASSCSAIVGSGQETSDVLDPLTGRPLAGQAACLVLAPIATEAEILSTALLAMGKARAADYIGQKPMQDTDIGWIERIDEQPIVTWLTAASND